MIRSTPSIPLTLLLLALLVLAVTNVVTADGTCSSTNTALYFCPNCGGIEVKDCSSECDGYLSTDTVHNQCIDRRLFQDTDPENPYQYLWNDLVGAVVWFIVAGVAIASGVGGGGIYVPLGILLFQFSPKQSSGLSQASIFGACLGGLLLNAKYRHPNRKIRNDPGVPDASGRRTVQKELTSEQAEQEYIDAGGKFYTRPVIYYDMAMFLAPMQMAGAVLGVMVQRVLPNWLYLLVAGLVLLYTAYKTYIKYFSSRKKEIETARLKLEKEQQEEATEDAKKDSPQADAGTVELQRSSTLGDTAHESAIISESDEEQNESTKNPREEPMPSLQEDVATEDTEKKSAELRTQYLEEDMVQYPKNKIFALIILWAGLFVFTWLQGGKGIESPIGINCESPWYYVLVAGQFLWMFGFAIFFGWTLLRNQAARVAVDYPYLPDDPIWDRPGLRFYGGFTFVAGIVAGMIGIGGGMVLGPLMLVMGIDPRVSSATNATMVVPTSSIVAVMFVISGLVPWSYALFYFFISFIGALVGKTLIDSYVKRTGRPSMLIFTLATIIALSTIGVFYTFFSRLAETGWCLDGFKQFCTVTDEEACPVNRVLSFVEETTASVKSLILP